MGTYVLLLIVNAYARKSFEDHGQADVVVWHLRHHVQLLVESGDVDVLQQLL